MLALVFCLAALTPAGQHKYGRIIIEGNTDTFDRVVHDLLGPQVRPGAPLKLRELYAGQRRLRACGYFKTNPWCEDISPTVEVLTNELDNTFLDVRIRIQEKPYNWLRWDLSELAFWSALGERVGVEEALRRLAYDVSRRLDVK